MSAQHTENTADASNDAAEPGAAQALTEFADHQTAPRRIVFPVGHHPCSIAITPNGRKGYVANSASGTVTVFATASNIVTATIVLEPPFDTPTLVAITPDGAKACVLAGALLIIDTDTDTVSMTVPAENNAAPIKMVIAPDSATAYLLCYADDASQIWEIGIATGNVSCRYDLPGAMIEAVIAPDGTRLYVLGDGSVTVIDTTVGSVSSTVAVGRGSSCIAITPDGGKVLVVNQTDNTVSVISTATDTVTATVGVGRLPSKAAVTPDGAKVYITNSQDFTVSAISTESDTVIAVIPVGRFPESIAVASDGTHVYVANVMGVRISVISTSTDTSMPGEVGAPYQSNLAVMPDNSAVYTTSLVDNMVIMMKCR